MKKKFKIILNINLIIILALLIPSTYVKATSINSSKTILIIGSYDSENEWEQSIINGFKSNLNTNNYHIKTEYLDTKFSNTDIYNESFMNLLNLKYKNDDILCILTLDDEALDLAKANVFNENSFMYKKHIIFVGANSVNFLTNEESKYITGIIEYQDNLPLIDLILTASKKTETIYILLDNSIFSKMIEEDILNISNLTHRKVNIEFIIITYFEDIENGLKNINHDSSAVLICGSYKFNSKEIMEPRKTISDIQNVTSAPIYTKIDSYVYAGAIGGIINDGNRLGIMAYNFLNRVLENQEHESIVPTYNSLNIPLFNFKALRKYNINPLVLPKCSTYINKGKFNFILPRSTEILTWIILIFSFIIVAFITIYSFISRKKLIKSDKLLKESIENSNIKTNFIITISHELRTPLNIILNTAKLLNMNIDNENIDPKYFKEKLNYINTNSNRLLKLINNLIDVTKIEYGYMDTNFQMENVVQVVEDSVLSVVDLANSHNIEIIFDTEEEEIYSAIDKSKIERIMLNLLSNSIKFTNNGGIIKVNLEKNNDFIVIKVQDNGIGIPENIIPNIFEKFYQVNPSLNRSQEGSGLGLFIVKGLISLHHGTISVRSKSGVGTEFLIKLPIVIIENKTSKAQDNSSYFNNLKKIELSDISDIN